MSFPFLLSGTGMPASFGNEAIYSELSNPKSVKYGDYIYFDHGSLEGIDSLGTCSCPTVGDSTPRCVLFHMTARQSHAPSQHAMCRVQHALATNPNLDSHYNMAYIVVVPDAKTMNSFSLGLREREDHQQERHGGAQQPPQTHHPIFIAHPHWR